MKLIYGLAVALFIVSLAGCGGSVTNTVTSTGSGTATATNTPNQPTGSENTTTTEAK